MVSKIEKGVKIQTFTEDVRNVEVFPDSTCFSYAAYNRSSKVLYLTFRESGESYYFFDVGRKKAYDLFTAGSMGSEFNDEVKDSYDYSKA